MVVFATMSFYDIMTLFKVGNVRMVHGGNLNSAWQAPEWRIIMRNTQSLRREYGYE